MIIVDTQLKNISINLKQYISMLVSIKHYCSVAPADDFIKYTAGGENRG